MLFSKRNQTVTKCLHSAKGFTLIELLVTIVVLSIGFLGMAGMSIKSIRMSANRKLFEASVQLAKSKLGQLGGTECNLLGSATTADNQLIYGGTSQLVTSEGPLNSAGKLAATGIVGPFMFTRSHVVCLDDAQGGAVRAASAGANACGNVTAAANRPPLMSCDTALTVTGQARVRVMVSYSDKDGTCHSFGLEQIVIDYTPTTKPCGSGV